MAQNLKKKGRAALSKYAKSSEPKYTKDQPFNDVEQQKILNWYRSYDPKAAIKKKFVIDYLKRHNIKIPHINSLSENYFFHPMSTLCRMEEQGFPLTDDANNFINKKIEEFKKVVPAKVEVKKEEKPVINPALLFKIKSGRVNSEIDYQFDLLLQGKYEGFDWRKFISELPPKYITEMINVIDKYIAEYEECLKNKELRDGHDIKPKRAKEFLKFFYDIKTILTEDKQVKKKANQKPRKKKFSKNKPITLKYNNTSEWKSISAEQLVGKTKALLYDTKKKQIIYIESPGGFVVDNVIRNVDTVTSFTQKLREKNISDFFAIHRGLKVRKFKDFCLTLTTKPAYNIKDTVRGNDNLVIVTTF